MKTRIERLSILCAAAWLLLPSVSQAQGDPETDSFSYQGYLDEAGSPANGLFDFEVTIWDQETAGTEVGTCPALLGVPVQNGIFDLLLQPTVAMSLVFDGSPRWIQVAVRESGSTAYTTLPRSPITASPYAWSLRPGARISASYSGTLLHLENSSSSGGKSLAVLSSVPTGLALEAIHKGDGIGVYAGGYGVYPALQAENVGSGYGGFFTGATALYARSASNAAPDIVLGGNSGTLDDGVLMSGNGYPSSDLVLMANDDVEIHLDENADEGGAFLIRNGQNTKVFEVQESGLTILERNSGTSDPHLKLVETSSNDFARISLRNSDNTNFWDVAAGGAGNDRLNFFRSNVGDVMTVRSSGRVGIWTQDPSFRLEVNGSAGKPGGGSWSVASDARLKHVGAMYDRGLEEILRLEPVRYNYLPDNPRGFSSEREHVGFVAQAVQEIIPEAVDEVEGYLHLNNDPILWAMVNAIQELHRENERLRQEISAIASHLEVAPSASESETRHAETLAEQGPVAR